MEVECHAPDDHLVALWIEPWGDRIEISAGDCVRLVFDGEVVEPVVVQWMDNAMSVGVPRHSILRLLNAAGDVEGIYDTSTLPPVPDGFRPI